jgi:hypothetical protein
MEITMKAVSREGFSIRQLITLSSALSKLNAPAGPIFPGQTYKDIVFDNPATAPSEAEVMATYNELVQNEALNCLRIVRDWMLAETDWWAASDRTITPAQEAYRQALRDLPNDYPNVAFAEDGITFVNVVFPVKP